MQISDIDICGKPADECDTVELVAALNAIKEKVRLYASAERSGVGSSSRAAAAKP